MNKIGFANKRFLYHILVVLTFFSTTKMAMSQSSGQEIGVKTVVIDAGHGGHDPGCEGSSAQEKEVALAIALKLGKYIETNYKDVEVLYTRTTDVFVELHERAKIANRNNADLFICIHANSGPPHAYGSETYVMGLHRTDAQQKIAEKENASILLEDNYEDNYKDFDLSPDAIIARSMQLSVFLNQSIEFAALIQKHFLAEKRKDRGVKQAGFLVLYKTTMPSVLIETGFLTNKNEESYLKDEKNQNAMAIAIFNAFKEYKASIESINSRFDESEGQINTNDEVVIDDKVETKEIKKEVIEKKPEEKSSNTTKNDFLFKPTDNKEGTIYFRVQIASSKESVPLKSDNFNGFLNVDEYISNGLHKYTIGNENSFESANKLKIKAVEKGYTDAFVIAFKDGKKMNLQDALELVNK